LDFELFKVDKHDFVSSYCFQLTIIIAILLF